MTYSEAIKEVLIEDFNTKILPLINGAKEIVLDNEYIKPITIIKNKLSKSKIDYFFDNLNKKTKDERIQFINDLDDKVKPFFVEIVSKIIDLNDNLQLYIMSYLTEQYIKNKDLDYYEKKLYYNINTLSEDDFKIFYCLFTDNFIDKKNPKIHVNHYKKKEIISISLNRFSNLGLLILKMSFTKNFEIIKNKEKYVCSEYSKKLYDCLDNYFKDCNCGKIIIKNDSTINY
jgi:hypothetical protein